jgi:hypothetical protein
VTGDAPQPGETPHAEGNPWSFDPDAAWWRGDGDREQAEALAEAAARPRHPRRRPPGGGTATSALPSPVHGDEEVEVPFLAETVDAHATGVQDAAEALTAAAPVEMEPVAVEMERAVTEAPAEEPLAVERDHEKRTRGRYRLAEQPEPEGETDTPAAEPDVMVMPEPDPGRNRPTVSLERGPVPGQSSGLTRQDPARPTTAGRNAQRARMENSSFWLTDEQRAAAGDAPPASETLGNLATLPGPAEGRRGQPPRVKPRTPRRSAPGLFGLMALALIAAFFSWVTAEPFWLAVGHGQHGVATVTRCTGNGVTQRCAGSFVAAGDRYRAQPVMLLGVDPARRDTGAVAPARMVNSGSKQAYVGATGLLVHLRWVLGMALVLLCGLGIAGITSTRQLETLRARRVALLMSLAGPVLLLVGFLVAAY